MRKVLELRLPRGHYANIEPFKEYWTFLSYVQSDPSCLLKSREIFLWDSMSRLVEYHSEIRCMGIMACFGFEVGNSEFRITRYLEANSYSNNQFIELCILVLLICSQKKSYTSISILMISEPTNSRKLRVSQEH